MILSIMNTEKRNRDIIVHSVPFNPKICGGIKVHYQLSMIEKELGYDSFIIYDNDCIPKIDWFEHSCKEMTLASFKDYLIMSGRRVFLTIGWEEPSSLEILRGVSDNLVAYIQGPVYYKKDGYGKDVKLWYISNYSFDQCGKSGNIVSPYISNKFKYDCIKHLHDDKSITLLLQERKAGEKAWQKVSFYLSKDILDKLDIVIFPDSPEAEFIDNLHECDIFFTHSYPEGLGLPSIEAMRSGKLVIGYLGSGGIDFMKNGVNCFISSDNDAENVAKNITNIVPKFFDNEILEVRKEGYITSTSYNKFRTIKEFKSALEELRV